MGRKKIGGNQRASRKFHMDRLVGKEVEAVFLIRGSSESSNPVVITDILERRDNPLSNNGYYLQNSNIHLPLKNSRYEGYTGTGMNPRLSIESDSYIEQQLKDNGVLK